MLMFSPKEIKIIQDRAKRNPEFIKQIELKNADVIEKQYIQQTGRATWLHYFMCPEHTVKLEYDHMNPNEYRCPVCGKYFSGEPYEGAWWRLTLEKNIVAAYELSVAYVATYDAKYLDTVHKILLGYAKYYPGYEVHGDIPYNHPGKATSQVLDDSGFGKYLLRAYDLTKETFTKEEQKYIEDNLFLEIGKHIKNQLVDQIHNHEAANCSTLASIGIYLGIHEFIDRGLNGKYGIKYQLDNAILKDGLWFEGTVGYHMYALMWFMDFEKMARHTEYSLMKDPHYRERIHTMMTFVQKLIKKDHTVPALNDGSQGSGTSYTIYEHGYAEFKDNEVLCGLYECLETAPRNNIDSFLYGVDNLPAKQKKEFKNYYSKGGSNLAVIHGSNERHFLFKALPYGGEHDHYDRLAISFSAFGKDICADLGTAGGYGAPLHYAYFKNTATHNTVVVNGDNMPPRDCKVNEYTENAPDDIYMDVSVDWIGDFQMPDSIFIKAWVDESYENTKMRRIVKWYDKYFIDIFVVDSPNELKKEWTWHIDGEMITNHPDTLKIASLSDKNPQAIFHDILSHKPTGVIKNTYNCTNCMLDVHTLCDGKEIIYAKGPANPSTHDLCYILERTTDKKTVYVNVIEAYKDCSVIDSVNIELDNEFIKIEITENNGTKIKFEKNL